MALEDIVSKANFIQHTTDYLPDYPASWVAIIMYIKAKLIVLPKHAVLHQAARSQPHHHLRSRTVNP